MLTIPQIQAAGGYQIILADPAWQYGDSGVRGGTDQHYKHMSLAEIQKLPIAEIAAENAALFMWGTYPLIHECLSTIPQWGFRYKTLAFQWVKLNRVSPTPFVGLGHWTRGNTEPCFLAFRGKLDRLDKSVRQLIMTDELLCAPRSDHSKKPEVHDRIVNLLGDLPRLELFARRKVPGWDAWGDEVVSDVNLADS